MTVTTGTTVADDTSRSERTLGYAWGALTALAWFALAYAHAREAFRNG